MGQWRLYAIALCILNSPLLATSIDITSITTTLSNGGSSTAGLLNYNGDILSVTSFAGGANTYTVGNLPDVFIIVHSGSNAGGHVGRETVWNAIQPPGTNNNNLLGTKPLSEQQTLSGNNVYAGTDNLFTNTGNSSGHQSDVERVDVIYTNPFLADPSLVFPIFERGVNNIHDPFRIAAITSLDSNGNPASYGAVPSTGNASLLVQMGWGTPVLTTLKYQVLYRDNNSGDFVGDNTIATQAVGGIAVPTSDLVIAGTPIYGYSLFPSDVNNSATSAQLVGLTAPCTNNNGNNCNLTPDGNSVGQGGIDLLALNLGYAQLDEGNAVPEPGSFVLAAAGLLSLALLRRRRN